MVGRGWNWSHGFAEDERGCSVLDPVIAGYEGDAQDGERCTVKFDRVAVLRDRGDTSPDPVCAYVGLKLAPRHRVSFRRQHVLGRLYVL